MDATVAADTKGREMTTIETIKKLASECEAAARKEGLTGTFELQPADVEWIAKKLGRETDHCFTSDELDALGIAEAFRGHWFAEPSDSTTYRLTVCKWSDDGRDLLSTSAVEGSWDSEEDAQKAARAFHLGRTETITVEAETENGTEPTSYTIWGSDLGKRS